MAAARKNLLPLIFETRMRHNAINSYCYSWAESADARPQWSPDRFFYDPPPHSDRVMLTPPAIKIFLWNRINAHKKPVFQKK